MKFSKGDADKQRREKTYQSMKNKQEEEPWINLRFNQVQDFFKTLIFQIIRINRVTCYVSRCLLYT